MMVDGPAGPPEPPSPRLRRFAVLVVAAWLVVLAVGGTLYALRGAPSAREETTVSQAAPTVDRALVDLARAAGPDTVTTIDWYRRTGTCDVTAARSGVRYQREILVYTAPGGEAAAVSRLAAGLPARYRATVAPDGDDRSVLTADAGDYVAVQGGYAGEGLVRVTADTGCRAPGRALPAAPRTSQGDRDRIGRLAAALGVPVTRGPRRRAARRVVARCVRSGSTPPAVPPAVPATRPSAGYPRRCAQPAGRRGSYPARPDGTCSTRGTPDSPSCRRAGGSPSR